MKSNQVEQILSLHCVPYKVENGHILADSMDASKDILEEVIDVTNWNRSQLKKWLGY